MNDAPIGILDSGSGGLSIWKEISSFLPYESIISLGDHGYMPYSNKTTEYIRDRVCRIIQFLCEKNTKLIVVACNTATVAGIEFYRKKFPRISIVGVVPVIKTAVQISKKQRIAVLSTKYTAQSIYQKKLIQQFAMGCEVEVIGSTRLVSLIEKGDLLSYEIGRELHKLLLSISEKNIDVLVLGCTHYPFVRDRIRAIVGESMAILDSGGAVARQVKRILEHNNALANAGTPVYQFFTTDDQEKARRVASVLLQLQKITVNYVAI